MNWTNLFGNEAKKRKSHLKNLISVAMADGHLDEIEWTLLEKIAERLEISENEIQHIKNNPETIKFTPPKKYEEKLQQVDDLVAVMVIDNSIDKKELELCQKIALNLDLQPRVITDLIGDKYKPQ